MIAPRHDVNDSRPKFDGLTKRALRGLQRRLQEILLRSTKNVHFSPPISSSPGDVKSPTFCKFPDFQVDRPRRRERAFRDGPRREHVSRRISRGTFHRKGPPKNMRATTRANDLHGMLFSYRKNRVVWPHRLGKYRESISMQDRAVSKSESSVVGGHGKANFPPLSRVKDFRLRALDGMKQASLILTMEATSDIT